MEIEIHITTLEIAFAEKDRFVNFCKTISAKPILIELSSGAVLQHPMISKKVKVVDRMDLDKVLFDLKNKFQESGYGIARVKLEVFSKERKEGILLFPDFKGGYYEWHGKVYSENLEELYRHANIINVHISKNGLKGIANRRILTIRETEKEQRFTEKINSVKEYFQRNGIEIKGEESEYCIFDSNTSLDKGWIDTPEITDEEYLDMVSFEAFLRRAAKFNLPFMLKGSILTRQFFSNKENRRVRDIDYLYFGEVKDDVDFMTRELSDWVEAVTSLSIADNVVYRPFSENKFWRAIDYAMNDDFPTTNTDLYCTVKNTVNPIIGLDVSWGLPLNIPPESIIYKPLEGEPFEIKYTAPLSLQISWKLHQCVVRPRLKDIIDVCYLLKDTDISKKRIVITVQEFIKECQKDKIDSERIFCFIDGSLRKYLSQKERLATPIFDSKSIKPPLSNMGELEINDIEFLKYTFPNYHLEYSNINDILIDFEELLKKHNFKEIFEEHKNLR